MFDVILATITIMGWFAFWSAVLTGLGNLLLGRNQEGELSFGRFWTGLGMVVLTLQIWHLFLPIDWKAAALIAAFGLFGWRSRIQTLQELCRQKWLLVTLLLLSAWAANLALRMPSHYDSGLYHFQSVRWANEYAIVPGLGNLHPRLAFNQSYFLYVALLNMSPWFQKGHAVANSLLFLVAAFQLLTAACKRSAPDQVRVFAIVMLALVLKQGTRESLSSPSPDYPVFLIATVGTLWLIETLAQLRTGDRVDTRWSIALLMLTCTGLTFKISFLAAGFATMAIVIGLLFRRATLGAAIVILFLGSWSARSLISSGYPLFPSTKGGIAFDWKVPEPVATKLRQQVYAWARNPGEYPQTVLKDSSWVKGWIRRHARRSTVNRPILVSAVCLAALVSLHYGYRQRSSLSSAMLLPALPSIAWLIFWFVTAPDPRFALAPLSLLEAWSVTLLLIQLFTIRSWDRRYLMWIAVALAVILAGRVVRVRHLTRSFGSSSFGALPTPPLKALELGPGLIVHVPQTNDQAWNAPLPSAPHPNRFLERRGESLQQGFRDQRLRTD